MLPSCLNKLRISIRLPIVMINYHSWEIMLPTIEPVDEQTIEVIPDGDRQANRGN